MAAAELAVQVGVAPACRALGLARATFYRRRRPAPGHRQPRKMPARALDRTERERVLDVLASPRFVDRAPAEVVATLLDEGRYLCSERTMYRLLAAEQPVRERRNQLSHPHYAKPELVATAPNQVWSWDITRLLGPKRWTYFYLYVLLDIFSRYVVGWMLAERETAAFAARLIEQSCLKQGIQPQVLTLHSDRGSPMTAKCTAQLLADLGVTPHSADPGSATTTRSPKPSSKPSSTIPASRAASTTSTPRPRSAEPSSPGTTTSIDTPVSPCSPPAMSTKDAPRASSNNASAPCKMPGLKTPNGSSTAPRNPSPCLTKSGSTLRRRKKLPRCSLNHEQWCLNVLDRFRSGIPRRASSCRMARDNAGWLMWSSLAAWLKCKCSAAARK